MGGAFRWELNLSGRDKCPTALFFLLSNLLLAPPFDQTQMEARGQLVEFCSGQESRALSATGLGVRGGSGRE